MIDFAIALLKGTFGRWILIGLAGLVLLLLATTGAAIWQTHSVQVQLADERADAATREATLARDAAEAEQRARNAERSNATNTAAIDAAYQRGLSDGKARTATTLASIRSGQLRVRGDLTASACRSGMPSTGAPSSIDITEAGTDLWRQSAIDLVRIGDEADDVVRQLNACIDKSHEDHQLGISPGR